MMPAYRKMSKGAELFYKKSFIQEFSVCKNPTHLYVQFIYRLLRSVQHHADCQTQSKQTGNIVPQCGPRRTATF